MMALLLAATLQIGVYYTFPPEKIILHNRGGQMQIEISRSDTEKSSRDLLRSAEDAINRLVFGGEKAFEFKLAFAERWDAPVKPLFMLLGARGKIQLVNAQGIDALWPSAKEPPRESNVDIYLTLLDISLIQIHSTMDGIAWFEQLCGYGGGRKVILANFELDKASDTACLLHELGHVLNLDHTNPAVCEFNAFIMCRQKKDIVFDNDYKNAWRELYRLKTGLIFEPRE